jgi:hypothetical protein
MKLESGVNDFDFLLGNWKVVNKRRKVRLLTDDPERNKEAAWEEFPATGGMGTKQLDGRVFIDYYNGTLPNGERIQGMAVRAYNFDTGLWSFIWLDNRQPADFTPLVGKFQNGIGEFFQVVETPDGKPLHVRFMWDNLSANTARWQQAFSLDGGETWDTNWIMEFSK